MAEGRLQELAGGAAGHDHADLMTPYIVRKPIRKLQRRDRRMDRPFRGIARAYSERRSIRCGSVDSIARCPERADNPNSRGRTRGGDENAVDGAVERHLPLALA